MPCLLPPAGNHPPGLPGPVVPILRRGTTCHTWPSLSLILGSCVRPPSLTCVEADDPPTHARLPANSSAHLPGQSIALPPARSQPPHHRRRSPICFHQPRPARRTASLIYLTVKYAGRRNRSVLLPAGGLFHIRSGRVHSRRLLSPHFASNRSASFSSTMIVQRKPIFLRPSGSVLYCKRARLSLLRAFSTLTR